LPDPVQQGVLPGVETPSTPDEVEAVDASEALQGLVVNGWRRVRRVRRVVWWFVGVNWQLATLRFENSNQQGSPSGFSVFALPSTICSIWDDT
jgi:hypothetical protein